MTFVLCGCIPIQHPRLWKLASRRFVYNSTDTAQRRARLWILELYSCHLGRKVHNSGHSSGPGLSTSDLTNCEAVRKNVTTEDRVSNNTSSLLSATMMKCWVLLANVATSAGFWLLRCVQVRSQISRPPAHCLQDGRRGHTNPPDTVDTLDIVDTPRHPPVDTKCGEDGGGDVPPPRDHDSSLRGGLQQQHRALPGDAAAAGEAQQEHEAEVQVSTVQHSTGSVQYSTGPSGSWTTSPASSPTWSGRCRRFRWILSCLYNSF